MGPFNYCTQHFLQSFTVHIIENGHYNPLVYFVYQPQKTYERFFLLLKNRCESGGF
jgi:hypothetical protein